MKVMLRRTLLIALLALMVFGLLAIGIGAEAMTGTYADDTEAITAGAVAKITVGETTAYYATMQEALEAVQDGQTITLLNTEGTAEGGKEIDFDRGISFTITGTAPNYALPIVTFTNATVTFEDAVFLTAELDARQNATINVVDSTMYDYGGNSIVKSYYNGAINISGNSVVHTMQLTTMGYITLSDTAQLNATWQVNVYGNGLVVIEDAAVLATGGLNVTGQEYNDRDNTDEDRVGKPATVIVDGGTLKAGDVQASNGADYSYSADGYGINIGTIEGKAALLEVKNGATVSLRLQSANTVNLGADGVINVADATLNILCRGTGTTKLNNSGNIYVTGTSNLSGTYTGAGWVYMNGVTLDADTVLYGAKVGFINGTNTIVGSVIDDGYFSVGIGRNADATLAADFAAANGITMGDVTVNVSGDAIIGSNGSTYSGWIGSAYSADKTVNKYVLNVENSMGSFGYLHISADGALNVTGEATNKTTDGGTKADFYVGDFIINGTATFEDCYAWAKGTKISVDHENGVLTVANGATYEASWHNGSNTSVTLQTYGSKVGTITVDNATLNITGKTTINANSSMILVDGAAVTSNGIFTNNGSLNVDASCKVSASTITGEGTITIDTANISFNNIITVIEQTSASAASLEDATTLLIPEGAWISTASYEDGDIVLHRVVAASITKEGTTTYFETLEDVAAVAQKGDTVCIELSTDETFFFVTGISITLADGVVAPNIVNYVATITVDESTVYYTTLADAIAAAKTMTGDVTVYIYGLATFEPACENLNGAYTSLNFVGKTDDAEVRISTAIPYLSGSGSNPAPAITFTDLICSKPGAAEFADNAAFMNGCFGVYEVASVTYTNCSFPNGVYAQHCSNTFTGCDFNNIRENSGCKYGLWVYANADVTITDSTFTGVRGIKMYTESNTSADAGNITLTNVTFDLGAAANYAKPAEKPAIVLSFGQSIELGEGTKMLDSEGNEIPVTIGLDGTGSNGTTLTVDGAVDFSCEQETAEDVWEDCGVLVGDKIYIDIDDAAAVAVAGDTVTVLYDTDESVVFANGVTITTAEGVTAENLQNAEANRISGDKTFYHATLADALAAAVAGDTIVLQKNITTAATLAVVADVTIDGNSFTITSNATGSVFKLNASLAINNASIINNVADAPAFVLGADVDLIIGGNCAVNSARILDGYDEVGHTHKVTVGSIALSAALEAEGYYMQNNGDGTYTISEHAVAKIGNTLFPSLADALYAAVDGDTIIILQNIELDATVAITKNLTFSGNFTLLSSSADVMFELADGVALTINCEVKSTAENGVILGNWNGSQTIKTNNTVVRDLLNAEGYAMVEEATGVWTVKAAKAAIGTKNYASLADALAAVQNDETIVLLTDAELTSTVIIDKKLTIDCGEYTITSSASTTFVVSGNLTVKGAMVNTYATGSMFTLSNGATVAINGNVTASKVLVGYDKALHTVTTTVQATAEQLNGEGYALVEDPAGTWTVMTDAPEAAIDGWNYVTLEDALLVGGTVTLLRDVTVEATIEVAGALTLTGDYTLTSTAATAFKLASDATLNINCALVATDILDINGGWNVSTTVKAIAEQLNAEHAGTVTEGSGDNAITIKLGYALELADGVYTVVSNSPEAAINGWNYKTLEKAISSATNGQTIDMLRSIETSSNKMDIVTNITLDGHNFKLKSTNGSGNAGLRVVDAEAVIKNLKLETTAADAFVMKNVSGTYVKATLINCEITSARYGLYLYQTKSADLIVEDTTITTTSYGVYFNAANANATLTDTTVNADVDGVYATNTSFSDSKLANVTLNGETELIAKERGVRFEKTAGTVTVEDNVSINSGKHGVAGYGSAMALTVKDNASITTKANGAIDFEKADSVKDQGSSVIVTGNVRLSGANYGIYTTIDAMDITVDVTGMTAYGAVHHCTRTSSGANGARVWYFYDTLEDALDSKPNYVDGTNTVTLYKSVTDFAGVTIAYPCTIDGNGNSITVADGKTAFTLGADCTSLALNNVSINGNILAGFNGQTVTTNMESVANALNAQGYALHEANGIWTVAGLGVVSLNGWNYATIQEALGLIKNGESLNVLISFETDATIVIDRAITIYGNGKSISSTANPAIQVSNTLTANDLTLYATGVGIKTASGDVDPIVITLNNCTIGDAAKPIGSHGIQFQYLSVDVTLNMTNSTVYAVGRGVHSDMHPERTVNITIKMDTLDTTNPTICSTGDNGLSFHYANDANVTLENVYIKAKGVAFGASQHSGNNADNPKVVVATATNCKIESTNGVAVGMNIDKGNVDNRFIADITLNNCTISGVTFGVILDGSTTEHGASKLTISGGSVTCAANGVNLRGDVTATISNTTITSTNGWAIYTEQTGDTANTVPYIDLTVTNGTLSGLGGIRFSAVADATRGNSKLTVTGGTITASGTYNATIDGTAGTDDKPSYMGILVSGAADVAVSNNTISAPSTTGIHFWQGCASANLTLTNSHVGTADDLIGRLGIYVYQSGAAAVNITLTNSTVAAKNIAIKVNGKATQVANITVTNDALDTTNPTLYSKEVNGISANWACDLHVELTNVYIDAKSNAINLTQHETNLTDKNPKILSGTITNCLIESEANVINAYTGASDDAKKQPMFGLQLTVTDSTLKATNTAVLFSAYEGLEGNYLNLNGNTRLEGNYGLFLRGVGGYITVTATKSTAGSLTIVGTTNAVYVDNTLGVSFTADGGSITSTSGAAIYRKGTDGNVTTVISLTGVALSSENDWAIDLYQQRFTNDTHKVDVTLTNCTITGAYGVRVAGYEAGTAANTSGYALQITGGSINTTSDVLAIEGIYAIVKDATLTTSASAASTRAVYMQSNISNAPKLVLDNTTLNYNKTSGQAIYLANNGANTVILQNNAKIVSKANGIGTGDTMYTISITLNNATIECAQTGIYSSDSTINNGPFTVTMQSGALIDAGTFGLCAGAVVKNYTVSMSASTINAGGNGLYVGDAITKFELVMTNQSAITSTGKAVYTGDGSVELTRDNVKTTYTTPENGVLSVSITDSSITTSGIWGIYYNGTNNTTGKLKLYMNGGTIKTTYAMAADATPTHNTNVPHAIFLREGMVEITSPENSAKNYILAEGNHGVAIFFDQHIGTIEATLYNTEIKSNHDAITFGADSASLGASIGYSSTANFRLYGSSVSSATSRGFMTVGSHSVNLFLTDTTVRANLAAIEFCSWGTSHSSLTIKMTDENVDARTGENADIYSETYRAINFRSGSNYTLDMENVSVWAGTQAIYRTRPDGGNTTNVWLTGDFDNCRFEGNSGYTLWFGDQDPSKTDANYTTWLVDLEFTNCTITGINGIVVTSRPNVESSIKMTNVTINAQKMAMQGAGMIKVDLNNVNLNAHLNGAETTEPGVRFHYGETYVDLDFTDVTIRHHGTGKAATDTQMSSAAMYISNGIYDLKAHNFKIYAEGAKLHGLNLIGKDTCNVEITGDSLIHASYTGIIYCPAGGGTFKMHLNGDARSKTTPDIKAGGYYGFWMRVHGSAAVTDVFTLDFKNVYFEAQSNGIHRSNDTATLTGTIDQCKFVSKAGTAIYLTNNNSSAKVLIDDLKIKNTNVTGETYGFVTSSPLEMDGKVTFENCNIHGNTSYGMYYSGWITVEIKSSTVTVGKPGVQVAQSAAIRTGTDTTKVTMTIRDSRIEHLGAGVKSTWNNEGKTEATVSDTGAMAIYSSNGIFYLNVYDSEIIADHDYGVAVHNGTRVAGMIVEMYFEDTELRAGFHGINWGENGKGAIVVTLKNSSVTVENSCAIRLNGTNAGTVAIFNIIDSDVISNGVSIADDTSTADVNETINAYAIYTADGNYTINISGDSLIKTTNAGSTRAISMTAGSVKLTVTMSGGEVYAANGAAFMINNGFECQFQLSGGTITTATGVGVHLTGGGVFDFDMTGGLINSGNEGIEISGGAGGIDFDMTGGRIVVAGQVAIRLRPGAGTNTVDINMPTLNTETPDIEALGASGKGFYIHNAANLTINLTNVYIRAADAILTKTDPNGEGTYDIKNYYTLTLNATSCKFAVVGRDGDNSGYNLFAVADTSTKISPIISQFTFTDCEMINSAQRSDGSSHGFRIDAAEGSFVKIYGGSLSVPHTAFRFREWMDLTIDVSPTTGEGTYVYAGQYLIDANDNDNPKDSSGNVVSAAPVNKHVQSATIIGATMESGYVGIQTTYSLKGFVEEFYLTMTDTVLNTVGTAIILTVGGRCDIDLTDCTIVAGDNGEGIRFYSAVATSENTITLTDTTIEAGLTAINPDTAGDVILRVSMSEAYGSTPTLLSHNEHGIHFQSNGYVEMYLENVYIQAGGAGLYRSSNPNLFVGEVRNSKIESPDTAMRISLSNTDTMSYDWTAVNSEFIGTTYLGGINASVYNFTNCTFYHDDANTLVIRTKGEVNLTNCTISSGTGHAIFVDNGTVPNTDFVLNMESCTLSAPAGNAILVDADTKVVATLKDVTAISGEATVYMNGSVGSILNIEGGIFMNNGTTGFVIDILGGVEANIYGGYFGTTNQGVLRARDYVVMNVYGGYYEMTPNSYHTKWTAMIRLGTDAGGGQAIVNVYGGTFVAPDDLFSIFNINRGRGINLYGFNAIGGQYLLTKNNTAKVDMEYPTDVHEFYANTPVMVDGAQVKLVLTQDNAGGIRFVSNIDADTINYAKWLADDADNVTFGTVIAPLDYVQMLPAFTVELLKAAELPYLDIVAKNGLVENADGSVTLRAVISEIKEHNYDRVFAAIAYVKVSVDGRDVYLYSIFDEKDNARSLKQLAASALADVIEFQTSAYRFPVGDGTYSRYTDEQRAALTRIVNCHYQEEIVINPTETTPGLKKVWCDSCGTYYEVLIPAGTPVATSVGNDD